MRAAARVVISAALATACLGQVVQAAGLSDTFTIGGSDPVTTDTDSLKAAGGSIPLTLVSTSGTDQQIRFSSDHCDDQTLPLLTVTKPPDVQLNSSGTAVVSIAIVDADKIPARRVACVSILAQSSDVASVPHSREIRVTASPQTSTTSTIAPEGISPATSTYKKAVVLTAPVKVHKQLMIVGCLVAILGLLLIVWLMAAALELRIWKEWNKHRIAGSGLLLFLGAVLGLIPTLLLVHKNGLLFVLDLIGWAAVVAAIVLVLIQFCRNAPNRSPGWIPQVVIALTLTVCGTALILAYQHDVTGKSNELNIPIGARTSDPQPFTVSNDNGDEVIGAWTDSSIKFDKEKFVTPGAYTANIDLAPSDEKAGPTVVTINVRTSAIWAGAAIAIGVILALALQSWWALGRTQTITKIRIAYLKVDIAAADTRWSELSSPPLADWRPGLLLQPQLDDITRTLVTNPTADVAAELTAIETALNQILNLRPQLVTLEAARIAINEHTTMAAKLSTKVGWLDDLLSPQEPTATALTALIARITTLTPTYNMLGNRASAFEAKLASTPTLLDDAESTTDDATFAAAVKTAAGALPSPTPAGVLPTAITNLTFGTDIGANIANWVADHLHGGSETSPAETVDWLRKDLRRTDLIVMAAAAAITIATGILALYLPTATWGTWSDWLAALTWGATISAGITAITSIVAGKLPAAKAG